MLRSIAVSNHRQIDSIEARQNASSFRRTQGTRLDEVGRPRSLADLEKLSFVGFDNPELRLGLMASRGVNLTTASFNFSTSSATLALELVRQGFGIGIFPIEIGEAYPELENPFLAFEPISIETWLVTHRELKTNLGIRLVFDLLAEGIGKK